MRRMFSEKQLEDLVNQGIEEGSISIPSGGTKLYKHNVILDDSMTNTVLYLELITTSNTPIQSVQLLGDIMHTKNYVNGYAKEPNDASYGTISYSNFSGTILVVWYFSEDQEGQVDFNKDIEGYRPDDTITPL